MFPRIMDLSAGRKYEMEEDEGVALSVDEEWHWPWDLSSCQLSGDVHSHRDSAHGSAICMSLTDSTGLCPKTQACWASMTKAKNAVRLQDSSLIHRNQVCWTESVGRGARGVEAAR
jgi:hypothetical protein